MLPSHFANILLTYQTFVTNLHLSSVELRCELQEKMHRVKLYFFYNQEVHHFANNNYSIISGKNCLKINLSLKYILIL